MRILICLLFTTICFSSQAQLDKDIATTKPFIELNTHQFFTKQSSTKPMHISFDWILETKAEIINGISYSPTIEFNISRPNGMNFQLQTGALPIIKGLNIQNTQPCAGLSFGYKF